MVRTGKSLPEHDHTDQKEPDKRYRCQASDAERALYALYRSATFAAGYHQLTEQCVEVYSRRRKYHAEL